jgi:hypothetical protein
VLFVAEELCLSNLERITAEKLGEFVINTFSEQNRRVRVEDVISAAAAITAEQCIAVAGHFSVNHHTRPPGTHAFSDRINEVLFGDRNEDVATFPNDSVLGILRDELVGRGYQLAEFPAISDVLRGFAAGVGNPAYWGKVPLSVPEANQPRQKPLLVACQTRKQVTKILAAVGKSDVARLRVAVLALAYILRAVANAIDHRLVLTLAAETLNGMAKTYPMTDDAYAQVLSEVQRKRVLNSSPTPQKRWWRFW